MQPMRQSFDESADPSFGPLHTPLIRRKMAEQDLDGFLVPHEDEHQNEYLPAANDRLAWATGFTGSAGAAVVLKDKAAVFVDGRYTLQVRQQTDTKLFDPRDLISEGVGAWIESNAPKGARIGYDPWLHSTTPLEALRASAGKAGATLVACDTNPIDAVWPDQ